MKPRHQTLTIPISLIKYCFEKKKVKLLKVFVVLKFYSDGCLKETEVFAILQKEFFKDRRTIKKYLIELLWLNWLGHDERSSTYYIRSLNKLQLKCPSKTKKAITCDAEEISKLQEIFMAGLIEWNLSKQRFYNKLKEKRGAVVKKGDAAYQNSPSFSYYGLSNDKLATIFNCSRTTACELKQKVISKSLIFRRSKYKDLVELPQGQYNLALLRESYNVPSRKVRIHTTENNTLVVRQQLHDEIHVRRRLKRRQ